MREIKFRAWDIKNHKMFQVANMSFRSGGDVFKVWEESIPKTEGLLINPSTGFLREFTGLKKKKGVEIYEGDICLTRSFLVVDGKQTRPEHRFAVEPTIESWYKVLCLLSSNNLKVIGNIYENKELLDDSKY